MEVQVAITMKESLGQNHARNRLSAKSYRCSILEVGEPVILLEMGSPPGESLKLSQLCGPGSAICDAGWPTPDCPWSMLVCRSQKKYFRNFNFNFNYRELLSKSVLLACVVAALCRLINLILENNSQEHTQITVIRFSISMSI